MKTAYQGGQAVDLYIRFWGPMLCSFSS